MHWFVLLHPHLVLPSLIPSARSVPSLQPTGPRASGRTPKKQKQRYKRHRLPTRVGLGWVSGLVLLTTC